MNQNNYLWEMTKEVGWICGALTHFNRKELEHIKGRVL